MSLRLSPNQAAALVAEQPLRPVDAVFPERRDALSRAVCTSCKRNDGYLDFVDRRSVDEYLLSGMCQDCQDSFFGNEDADLDY